MNPDFFSKHDISWQDLSAVLLKLKLLVAQGHPKSVALPRALESSGNSCLIRLSERLRQPSVDVREHWMETAQRISHPSLRQAFRELLRGVLSHPDGVCRLDCTWKSFQWRARTERLFSQSIAQIHAQSNFFLCFVPLFSVILIFRGFEMFIENILSARGSCFLLLAVGLYGLGFIVFRNIEGRAIQFALSDNLARTSGQMRFLETLAGIGNSLGHRVSTISHALENLGDRRWREESWALRMGRRLGSCFDSSAHAFPEQRFLTSVQTEILESHAWRGKHWTEQTLTVLRGQMRHEVVRLVARLNLLLLFPLALFFLPALFLMLILTGSSLSVDTIR
jgi:hypothetical protein